MKTFALMALMVESAHCDVLTIQKYASHVFVTGFLTFVFLATFIYIFIGALAAVQTPFYQLPANDEKNKENNREWQLIW